MARFENCLNCGKRLTGTTIFCAPCMACLCSWECRQQHIEAHTKGKILASQEPGPRGGKSTKIEPEC